MAHAKTTNDEARLVYQCGKGMRTRLVRFVPVILAVDRGAIDADSHFLADVIDGEVSCNKSIMIAPCAGVVERVFTNAIQYPATAGAATVTFYKANIGAADTALNTAIDIDNPTDETAIDGVLSIVSGALDVIEGQLLYATIALSAITAERSDGLVVGVEFRPAED